MNNLQTQEFSQVRSHAHCNVKLSIITSPKQRQCIGTLVAGRQRDGDGKNKLFKNIGVINIWSFVINGMNLILVEKIKTRVFILGEHFYFSF